MKLSRNNAIHVPWWLPFGRVESIRPDDLNAQIAGHTDLQIVDVREPFEFAESHIAGAQNVPIHDLPRRLDALALDPRRPVVAICLSGHRSIPAYRLLTRAGYQVSQLEGGMLAWWRSNLPTTRGKPN